MLTRHAARAAGAACLSALLAFSNMTPASAEGISLVRDAETENMVREYSTPIWRAAGLTPASVRIYLVQDPNINAFVAVGQRMFLNTGLITQVDTPLELVGVIAHETGHMAGGHLIRGQEAMEKLSMPMIASMILGVGAMAAGAGDVGMAAIAGGATVAERSILAYSRQQEASADQAGASYLEKAGLSGQGMLDLFAKFRDQEALSSTQQDPFIRSHPISEDRLSALEERVQASPFYHKEDSPERIHRLKMIQAKLNGFVDDPEVTFRRYPSSDQSDYARYARAIAFHKNGDLDRSQSEIDLLLQKESDNPYIWELKGQVFFEAGRVVDSIAPYRKALALKSDEPQIELALGQALLAVDPSNLGKDALAIKSSSTAASGAQKTSQTRTDAAQLEIAPNEAQLAKEALGYLQSSVKRDSENPTTYFQLAIAYGRLNNIGMAELSTAEYYDSVGATRDARAHAAIAQKHLKRGSPEWLRAQDIMRQEG